MFWTVSFRNDLPLQILEDYDTGELKFNQAIELPYTEHEAACENQMGVINRWLERLTKAEAGMRNSKGKRKHRFYKSYATDYQEAVECYEYNLRELDHLIRRNAMVGAERIHSDCETCDKIDAANVKRYN